LTQAFFWVTSPQYLSSCLNSDPQTVYDSKVFTVFGPMNGVQSRFNYDIYWNGNLRPGIVVAGIHVQDSWAMYDGTVSVSNLAGPMISSTYPITGHIVCGRPYAAFDES
jgi:hypothetical protein